MNIDVRSSIYTWSAHTRSSSLRAASEHARRAEEEAQQPEFGGSLA